MKGLLYKESFTVLRQNETLIIAILLLNAFFLSFFSDIAFLSAVTMFFITVFVVNSVVDDVKTGFSEYEKTMPVTKKDIVLSKYLFGAGFMVVGPVGTLATEFFITFMFDIEWHPLERMKATFFFAAAAYLLLCIFLPLIYRCGIKIGFFLNLLALSIPTALSFFIDFGSISFPAETGALILFILVAAGVSAAIISLSILLSLRLVERH